MDFSITQEIRVLLASVCSGFLIGILYDLMRTVRSFAGPSNPMTALQDAVFWFLATMILFFTIFHTNNGIVRWYEFFGAFWGAFLYFWVLSQLMRFLLKKITQILMKIFVFFCKILLTPLCFMYNIIYKGLLFVFVPVFKVLRRFVFFLRKRVATETKRTRNALLKK